MKIEIEVKRRRSSVTQGMADVFINGKKVMDFGDDIKHIEGSKEYYGEKIGNWASATPDMKFIIGMLYHPYDDIYHYSDKARAALEAVLKEETQ